MAPDDLTDSELLREMYREITIIGERLSTHLKFHSDVIRSIAWIAGCAVSIAGIAVAAKAAGIF